MRKIILTILLALALMLGGLPACAAEDAAPQAVKAADLYGKELEEVRQLYGPGLLTVTGVATYVGPDRFGLPAIELSDAPEGTTYVLSVLPFGDFFKLGDVKVGDTVTVSGDPRGKAGDGLFILKQSVILTK